MMKNKNRLELIGHLENLGLGLAQPIAKQYGICHEMRMLAAVEIWPHTKTEIDSLLRQWDKFSGNDKYPVPHDGYDCPEHAFNYAESEMWDSSTQYGRDRMELCLFLADQMRKNL